MTEYSEPKAPKLGSEQDAKALEYKAILNTLSEMVYVLDKNYIYRFMNRAYALWFELPIEDTIGKSVAEVHGVPAFTGLKPFLDKGLSGQVISTEMVLPSKTGIQRLGQGIYTPMRSQDGKISGLVASVWGLAESQPGLEQARRKQGNFEFLPESQNEGLFRFELTRPIPISAAIDTQIQQILEEARVAEYNNVMAGMFSIESATALNELKLEQFLPQGVAAQTYLRNFINNGYQISHIESFERDSLGRPAHFSKSLIGVVENNHLVRAWATQKNTTHEVQSRENLRRSEERFRMASEAGNVGIWEWDIQTGELFWSDLVKIIYGFPLDFEPNMDEYRGRIHPEDAESAMEKVQAALNPDSVQDYVAQHRIIVNGTTKWVRGLGKVVFDDNGRPLRMSGTVVDFTAQKEAENKFIQLRELGINLSKIMTTEALANLVIDFGTSVLGASASAVYQRKEGGLSLFGSSGYSKQEIGELCYLAQDAKHPFADAGYLAKPIFLETRATMNGAYPELSCDGGKKRSICAIPMLLDDAAVGVISLQFAHEKSFDNDSRRFMLTFADQCAQTLERIRFYEKEKIARLEAEGANKAKSLFLANMSHEIRTPLGAILGFAELIKDPDIEASERDKFISIIMRNGNMLNKVINDILDLSKIESEQLEMENLEFNIKDLVKEVLSLLGHQAQEKRLELNLTLDDNVPQRIISDPTRLKQILINLVGNALKFTTHGRIEIVIVSVEGPHADRHQVKIQVIDTGLGIASEHAERIFESFVQADSSMTRQFGGTGLGLVISKRLAQVLGGELILEESAPGKGSTFSFTLDAGSRSQGNELDSAEKLPGVKQNPSHKELSGLKILLVDDGPDNQLLISRILQGAGAEVFSARNGKEAVEAALSQDFDLVLMDIQMPEMDGFGALKALQKAGYQIPVLALTAHAMKVDREQSLRAGFLEHLVKPIDRKLLLDSIKRRVLYTKNPIGLEAMGLDALTQT